MAILDSLEGVEVCVWSRGSKLTEYNDDDDEVRRGWSHKTVSNYIESVTDSEFFIRLKVQQSYVHDCDELGFSIIMDGCEEDIDSVLCGRVDLVDDDWEHDAHGVETHDAEGAKVLRFRFSKLLTTDGETRYINKTEKEILQKIGQIEVRVHQLEHSRSTKRKPKQLRGTPGVLPEKLFGVQAISHSVSYDIEERLAAPSTYQGTKYMHDWDGPIGVFRFKYRSRSNLQQELIIPRTPSPEPPGPTSAAALTSEQRFRLARMKYDDVQMLRSLTGVANTNAAHQHSTAPQQDNFEDLTLDEIDRLAWQKHAEMTGVPVVVKPEPGIAIKQEAGVGNAAIAAAAAAGGSSKKRRRPFPVIQLPGGKLAVDLTADDGDDDGDDDDHVPALRLRAPRRDSDRSESKSATLSAQQQQPMSPSPQVSVCTGDEDDIVVCAMRKVKRRMMTGVEGRPFVPKKDR